MHGVLKSIHPIVGTDLHIPWPPASPAPAPTPVPYRTATTMLGTAIAAKYDPTTVTCWGATMVAGTDAGLMIPHVGAPSQTLPLDMLGSASKSHFGSSKYRVAGGKAAVALACVVNPNLDCGTPMPTPTGAALAPTTHFVGMTMGDFQAGLVNMAVDVVLQTACNFAGTAAGNMARSAASRLAPNLMASGAGGFLTRMFGTPDLALRGIDRFLSAPLRGFANALDTRAGGYAFDFVFGSPLGVDAGAFGLPTAFGAVTSFFGVQEVDTY
ncbi:MAG: hypothetical protein PF961_06485 [Planctomycetota bacterium]|jgi:hypothetical protein|nr:hypothetical protein [Planctomycetota bacterium]